MKGERKLSLVKPPADAPEPTKVDELAGHVELPDDEPPVTAEELREAEELRAAMERGEDEMSAALRSAFAPKGLGEGDLDAILARAMGDLDAPATALEQGEADRLRTALEEHDAERAGRLVRGPGARNAGGSVAREEDSRTVAVALRAAWAPTPLGAAKNDALVSRALEGAAAGAAAKVDKVTPAAKKGGGSSDGPAPLSLRRFRMGPRTFGAMAAVVATVAGVLLFVGRFGQHEPSSPASVAQAPAPAATASPAATAAAVAMMDRAPRIASRSTTDLFDAATPFPRTGGESARVDRIAGARAADLRANRFASWGVR